jgi:pilus assembly protein CpaF
MSTVELPMVAVRAQVASAINFIVCCERYQDGSRKTHAVAEVLPLNDKGEYRTQDIWLYTPVAKDEDGKMLGYHAPTGILPTFMLKARAYGFTDLDASFFDPATYGVPPPPLVHGLGEQVTTHWAPSLKHREKHQPDPDDMADQFREFELKLKADAKASRAQGSVQVPGAITKKPAAGAPPPRQGTPSRPPQQAQRRDDDNTPPPTRNPLNRGGPADSGDDDPHSTHTAPRQALRPGQVTADEDPEEPKVAISESLLGEMDEGEYEAPQRRTASSPQQPAARPQVRGSIPPRGVPPKRQ